MTGMRAVRAGLAAALLLAAASGCGGDSDDADGAAAEAGGSETAAAPSVADVKACLEEGGIDASGESNLPEALREASGIEETLVLAGEGDLVGLGAVTWYVDEDAANEAYEAGGAVRTDEVARGVQGRLDYHYSGSEAAVALLESCL